ERALRALERLEQHEQPLDLGLVEPRPAVADVLERAVAIETERERAKSARPPALPPCVAGDHELLTVSGLHLEPVVAAPAGCVPRADPLGDDSLESLLTSGVEE